MKNIIRLHLDLSSLQQPAGVEGFLKVVKKVHNDGPIPRLDSHLSEDGLTRLVRASYYSSQVTNEGRYPSFRLFAYDRHDKDDQLRTVIKFDLPIQVTIKNLTKLAPIATAGNHALVVVEQGSSLLITRMITMAARGDAPELARPEYWTSDDLGFGLLVSVIKPGHLRVTVSGVTVDLRAGVVEELAPMSLVSGVSDWLREASDQLHSQFLLSQPEEHQIFGGAHGMRTLLQNVWSDLLRSTINLGHGGAFIVVPDDVPTDTLKVRYTVEHSGLDNDIIEFWARSVAASRSNAKSDLDHWLRGYKRFRQRIHATAALSAVDGAVVLNSRLRVLGFGCEILVNETAAMKAPQVLKNAATGQPRTSQDSSAFGGTRHRSAFRFCKAVAGSLAFVVSQDRDLTVFFSQPGEIFAFGSLIPRWE